MDQVDKITFEHRRLMFPLIIGGTAMTLILVSMLKNLFNPWVILPVLVISAIITYMGWAGTNVLTIKEYKHDSDFMLRHISINMKAFVDYVWKTILYKRGMLDKKQMLIYHICNKNEWEVAKEKNTYTHESLRTEGFIHASSYQQVIQTVNIYYQNEKDLILLAIDPEKVKSEIRYEKPKLRDTLFPHIYGPLNIDAVIETALLDTNKKGEFVFPQMEILQND